MAAAELENEERLHSLIHCNLKELSTFHPILFPFEVGMFKVPNAKGLQSTLNYIMNIIEPVKYAKMVCWPLLDRRAQSEFRIAVKALLMEISEKCPEAGFPPISPSFLMNTCGQKFTYFMWKLTKFALYRCLNQRCDMLHPPRSSKDDPMAQSKLHCLQVITKSLTQNAVENQIKIDSVTSQENERHVELEELDQEIRKYEETLKYVVEDAPLSDEMKQKLSDLDNHEVISEWATDLESKEHDILAIVNVLMKIYSDILECGEALHSVDSNEGSLLCINAKSLNICDEYVDENDKELLKKKEDGKLQLSEFIQLLNRLLELVIGEVNEGGLQNINSILPELHNVGAEFQEVQTSISIIDDKLKEKLSELETNIHSLLNDLYASKSESPEKDKSGATHEICESVLDDAVSSKSFVDASFTPVQGTCQKIIKKHTETEPSSSTKFNYELLLTPEFNNDCDSPVYSIKKSVTKSVSEKSYNETPCRKNIVPVRASTSKKSHEVSLPSLTKSLLRKKKHDTLIQNIQSASKPYMQGQKRGTKLPISKDLLHSLEETEKVSEFAASSEENLRTDLLHFESDEINEDLSGIFPSHELEDSDVKYPPSLLYSTTSTETCELESEKENRRKSLDAIIQRYHKIRANME